MRDKETIDVVLALYDTVLSQAAHFDDIRVGISILVITGSLDRFQQFFR